MIALTAEAAREAEGELPNQKGSKNQYFSLMPPSYVFKLHVL
jgi:hypothetical protein